jgi:hypothetical protein
MRLLQIPEEAAANTSTIAVFVRRLTHLPDLPRRKRVHALSVKRLHGREDGAKRGPVWHDGKVAARPQVLLPHGKAV